MELGKHILHLDASHGPDSVLAQGTAALWEQVPEVRHRRLWEMGDALSYRLEHVRAKMALLAGRAGEEERAAFKPLEVLALEVATARALVVSAPMWNYGVPYAPRKSSGIDGAWGILADNG